MVLGLGYPWCYQTSLSNQSGVCEDGYLRRLKSFRLCYLGGIILFHFACGIQLQLQLPNEF